MIRKTPEEFYQTVASYKYYVSFCFYFYEARAEFCQIFRSFFGQWRFKKKCFWDVLTFSDGDFLLLNEIDSWNFQQMLDLGFSETSQNFSSFRQLFFYSFQGKKTQKPMYSFGNFSAFFLWKESCLKKGEILWGFRKS